MPQEVRELVAARLERLKAGEAAELGLVLHAFRHKDGRLDVEAVPSLDERYRVTVQLPLIGPEGA